ncbi:MAG: hypothetical protein ABJN24_05535 [Hyphomicrobiales bacterium]
MKKEPDFEAFEDWLVYHSPWPAPSFWVKDNKLSSKQKSIVKKNAGLLLDKEAWIAHVATFEKQLTLIEDEDERSRVRAKFHIRFDHHCFPDHKADFSGFHFPCSVSFSGATFGNGGVRFNGAKFGEGNVWFQNIKLAEARISFEDIDVAGNFFVRNTRFPKKANFQRASVKGTADFSRNIFHKVPDFRDTVFARSPEVARMEVPPPEMKGKRLLKIAKDAEDAAKYRKLKAMALAANDHEKDIEFFAYEMRAKRGREKGSIKWYELLINSLYSISSNFGQSYWRPASGLAGSLSLFFVLYAVLISKFLTIAETLCFAFFHSFKNFVPFLGSLFRFAARPEGHPSGYDEIFHELAHDGGPVDWLVYLGIFQNFFGLILLFLLLLGLRNKFRLK